MSYISGISHSVASEMAGHSHTQVCCLSKLRSSLGAGKKQLRVWLEYVCSMAEMLLYSSFGAPSVFPWSLYDSSKMVGSGFLDKPSGKAEREDGSKWYATGNVCSCANRAVFVVLRIYVRFRTYQLSCGVS